MSSFFRSPNDLTDTQKESSRSLSVDLESKSASDGEDQNATGWTGSQAVAKIKTIDSTSPERPGEGIRDVAMLESGDSSDWILHALLEERCLHDALADFQKQDRGREVYTRDHPEVQKLAESKYKFMAGTLGKHALVSLGPAEEDPESRAKRQAYRQGLDMVSSNSPQPGRPGLTSRPSSLVHFDASMRNLSLNSSRVLLPSSIPRYPPIQDAHLVHSSEAVAQLPPLVQPLIDHPMFEFSRYLREFTEVGIIGQGGYGKVYHVKHKLDGSSYAIKKIGLNAGRVRRIKERGQAELDSLLNELRMLAQFDHPNIVRYFGGWLEYTMSPLLPPPAPLGRLMLEVPQASSGAERPGRELDNFRGSLARTDGRSGNVDVVFERSGGAVLGDLDEQEDLLAELKPQIQSSRKRRESAGTTASAQSKQSSTYSMGDDDADDVVNIHHFAPATASDSSDPGLSSFGHTNQLEHKPEHEAVLTLHIQMSLHPLSLAEFLTAAEAISDDHDFHSSTEHCFEV